MEHSAPKTTDLLQVPHGATAIKEADVSNVIDNTMVRNQLYREEPRLPTIPSQAAALIGTTSMLFLKDLVRRCVATEDKNTGHNDRCIVSASRVKQVAEDTEAFAFLRGPLQEITDTATLREYIPKGKKRQASATSTKSSKKLATLALVGATNDPASDTMTLVNSAQTDQIVVDDDEYD